MEYGLVAPGCARIDAVVIGRNEGQRLARCLASLQGQVRRVVYVDSGSVDGSVELAHGYQAQVVLLDPSHPFTAARARNAGLAALQSDPPDFVQMLDGDCIMDCDWLDAAQQAFQTYPRAAAVFGRRREIAPQASVYNRLCDREWGGAPGQVLACGGDVLFCYRALAEVGFYRADLIAGEEPELCQRLRRQSWEIWRIGAEMTRHDAGILRFGQWWRRMRRAGFAFAQGAVLHGAGPDRHWVAERNRALLWGFLLPLMIVVGAVLISPMVLGLAALWGVQILRLAYRWRGDGRAGVEGAIFLTLAKLPEAVGIIDYYLNRLLGRQRRLIEYK